MNNKNSSIEFTEAMWGCVPSVPSVPCVPLDQERKKFSERCPVCKKMNWRFDEQLCRWKCIACEGGEEVAADVDSCQDSCQACGSDRMWLPVGRDDWLCAVCQPPPRESFVRDRRGGDDAYVIEELTLASAMPQCETCGSRWMIEKAWSDRSVEERCWCCQTRRETPRISPPPIG